MINIMKNKTPLQELMAAIYDLPPLAVYKWMEANKVRLIAAEREMLARAWVSGFYYYDFGNDTQDLPIAPLANTYVDNHYGK